MKSITCWFEDRKKSVETSFLLKWNLKLWQIPEDSLTAARLNHEQYLLDDLIDYVESFVGDDTKVHIVVDKVRYLLLQ